MNRLSIRIIVCAVSLLLSVSCNRQYIANTLVEFTKSEIFFPKNMEVCADGTFSMAVMNSLRPVKMIIYYDSTECSSCRISHLIELEALYADASEDGRYDVVTIFSPGVESLEEVRLQLAVGDFSFPVYIDTYGSFAEANGSIPEDERFHSFLTDEDGHPVFVGNPVGSERLQGLFQEVLAGIHNQ